LDKSPRFLVPGVVARLLFIIGTNNQQSTT
jgi:hypothetical protein